MASYPGGTQDRAVAIGKHEVLYNKVNAYLFVGTGAPEGVVAAPVGSLFLRTNGGTSTSLYVKETGTTTSSGWVAK
jgi:hypothetical protein